jgi:hypothetical protein
MCGCGCRAMSCRRRHRRLIVFSDQHSGKRAARDQPLVGTGTGRESERCYAPSGDGPRSCWGACRRSRGTAKARTGASAWRASFDAFSAPQAERWVAVARRTISPALDPDASQEAWEWLWDGRIATRKALLRAEPCMVTLTQAGTSITWTIRPALFLPLTHRQGLCIPACANQFKPRRAFTGAASH